MISVFGSQVGSEEIAAVKAIMESQWMGFGKEVDKFEKAYKQKFGIENFALVDSGSNALYMAVKLLDLPEKSDIILPSFTWVSCAQAVVLAGHNPIFCDVDIKTMNVTQNSIERSLTNNTKAIMIVHYAGLPVEFDSIKSFGLPIIEDAAHAVCSKYRGVPCGELGDIGIYSFDAVKNLTVGEGGGICTKNKKLLEKAKTLRYCGIGKSGFDSSQDNINSRWWEYNINEPFIKMLPTNIAAAIGLAQLQKIDDLQSIREKIWRIYNRELSSIDQIITPIDPPEYSTHSYFTYCIRCERRDELAKHLLDNGIYTTLRYHPLHLSPIYKQTDIILPNTEKLNLYALSIPLHPRLTEKEVEFVVNTIRRFYST